ncbi:MAG: SDR family oxidoreductase [Sphingomonadaceae bacterium]|nr:SDR family oxidoreductase [Sphingomonadaceae bacterium]
MTLAGKTVVVVGGTSGVGLHIVLQAAAAGAKAVGLGRSPLRVAAAQEKARAAGVAAVFEQADGTDETSLRAALERHAPIAHVVASALDAEEHALGDFRKTGTAGLKRGMNKFWLSCTLIEQSDDLLEPDGSITLMSGSDERKAWPGVVAHAIVGGALNALVRTLAIELAPHRINVICPGPTVDSVNDAIERPQRVTGMQPWGERFPLKRVGDSSEVAHGALFLMTNGYVTGTILDIDGGASV